MPLVSDCTIGNNFSFSYSTPFKSCQTMQSHSLHDPAQFHLDSFHSKQNTVVGICHVGNNHFLTNQMFSEYHVDSFASTHSKTSHSDVIWCRHHGRRDQGSISTLMTKLLKTLTLLLLLLFLWLFPSSGVAAMVVDRLFPVSPVSFIALSQSYSLHVPLAHILPPCLWSPSLPFPRYRFRHHSPHYVIFLHPHDVPIPFQSSLRYLSGRLHYFRRSSDVFVPDFIFSCHSTHPPQHPHLVHLNPWLLSFGGGPGFSSI